MPELTKDSPAGWEPVPEEVRARVKALVAQFKSHQAFFTSPEYKEDQLCREFRVCCVKQIVTNKNEGFFRNARNDERAMRMAS